MRLRKNDRVPLIIGAPICSIDIWVGQAVVCGLVVCGLGCEQIDGVKSGEIVNF